MPLPEQTVSVIDELKKRGFTPQAGERLPLYGARESLYKQSGLESALGGFTGTGAQNTKLLEWIRNNNINPQAVGQPPALTTTVPPAGTAGTSATSTLATAGGTPQPQRMPTAEELGVPKSLTAQEVLSQIGTVPGTTAEQVLATPLGGLTYQESQRKAQEAIAAGEAGAVAKAEQFGTAGLYFSGARVSAEGAERAKAMSEKMGIDESLTRFIIQQQESGDKETATRIQQIVKDAVGANEKARSEAISALGALGYVVMPDGSIVQKPSEIRAIAGEERAARDQTLQEAKTLEPDIIITTINGEKVALDKKTLQVVKNFGKSSVIADLNPTAFNLRAGISGLSKDQVNDLSTSTTPTSWFKSQEESKTGMSLTSGALSKRWLDAQAKLQKAITTNTIEDIVNNAIIKAFSGVTID